MMTTTETKQKENKHVYQLALPPSVVAIVDKEARVNGLSRSAFVTMILSQYVHALRG